MIKKTVTYMDYDGNSQTDVLYFNLTKAELGKLQMKMDGKFIDHLQLLIEKKHIEALYDFFYNLLLDSYGEKDASGKKFNKTPEMRANFENSIAFSEALMDIISDKDKMAEFTKGVLPAGMVTEAGGVNAKAIPATT